MGEAKQKEAARSEVTDVHLTYDERLSLIQLFQVDRGKTTEERRKRRRIASALMLSKAHYALVPVIGADGKSITNQNGGIVQMYVLGRRDGKVFKQLKQDDRDEARLYEVTGEAAEYLLKLLSDKGGEPFANEDVVLDLEERFLQVQRKEYTPPEGLLRAGEGEEFEDLDIDPSDETTEE